mmetsp:Transcript_9441/g.8978  ORF Transcript_9441/g.8978 Transcript_9441/m.8978 type:complete len:172 (+) Transcript_9441:3827-4342(+)
MSTLWDSPYSLAAGTVITAKVLAHNARGWGGESAPNAGPTPIVETVPDQMSPLTSGSLTSHNKIELDWTPLSSPADGESTITSYVVYWDQGISSWVELVGDSSNYAAQTYLHMSSVQAGTTYSFKVKARNAWGDGDFSTETQITALGVPDQMAAATTTIDGVTGEVTVQWI